MKTDYKKPINLMISDLNNEHPEKLFIGSKLNRDRFQPLPTKTELIAERVYADYKFQKWIDEQIEKGQQLHLLTVNDLMKIISINTQIV